MVLLLVLTAAGCSGNGAKSAKQEPKDIQAETAAYLLEQVPEPAVSSTGGEWTVIGLARGNIEVPADYYDIYYDNVRAAVKSGKGVLDERRYTEYARVSIALNAIGKDPTDVEGYDLLEPLCDYEEVISQGINGSIYALIAANTCGYELKGEKRHLKRILEAELDGGGFSFDGEGEVDADVTGMALQALAPYKEDEVAMKAAERSIEALSRMQQENGGFGESSETISQVIRGLSAAGVDPMTDERFIKGENGIVSALMEYWTGEGFSHEAGGEAELLATEQAMCALDEFVK